MRCSATDSMASLMARMMMSSTILRKAMATVKVNTIKAMLAY